MSHQVLTIRPDGSIVGLQVKKGKGLDLRTIGKVKVERVTLIEWSEGYQKWFIRPVDQPGGSFRWRRSTIQEIFPEGGDGFRWRKTPEGIDLVWPDLSFVPIHCLPVEAEVRNPVLYFDEYEEAVHVEVAVIQARMLAGNGLCAVS